MDIKKEETINQFFYDGNVCPNCKTAFKIVYSGSHYYACTQCMAYLDIRDKENIKKTASSNKKFQPSLPLGSKGVIQGIRYEVIAYARCREKRSIYTWNEYYLYNRSDGFAYLSECDGHWIYLTHPVTSPGERYSTTFVYEGRNYQLYNSYNSEITYLEGEFDHDVIYGEKKGVYEYIHPPYMLSCERSGQKVENWIQGEHIENSEIAQAFSVPAIPGKTGVGMIQPLSMSYTILGLWKVFMIGLLGLLLTHIIVSSIKPSYKVVFEQTYTLSDTANAVPSPVVTVPFTIPEGILSTDNLEIILESPVSNTWFETQINLINDKTGEEFNVETGVEYYYGPDYSEGGQIKDITLSEIPAGTYHMNIFPAQDTNYSVLVKPTWYRIKLTRGVEMWSNLFIIIACMAAFPLIQFYRYRAMEKQRWENSNYG